MRPYLQTISDLNATVRKLERRLRGGADGDLIMQKQAAEEQRVKREGEYRRSKQDEVVNLANLSRRPTRPCCRAQAFFGATTTRRAR